MAHAATKEKIMLEEYDFYKFCAERGYNSDLIRSKNKKSPIFKIRMEAANFLRNKGYRLLVLGAVMRRNHTSIMNLCSIKMRQQKRERHLQRTGREL